MEGLRFLHQAHEYFSPHLRQKRRIQVHGQDVEAIILKALGDRSPDPACRAGYDGGPPVACAFHRRGL